MENIVYAYKEIYIDVIQKKTHGEWCVPYFNMGKLYQSIDGIATFNSQDVLNNPYDTYSTKFIDFVCNGSVDIVEMKKSTGIKKITRPGVKEFIVLYELDNTILNINEELLTIVRQWLPPMCN